MNNLLAIEDIKINNEELIPSFNKNIFVYNYFTNKDKVYIDVTKRENENVKGEGIININESTTKVIVSNSSKEYIINIFKNYDKDKREESYIKNISIDGYDLKYDRNIHEYSIYIDDEDYLNINCELSNLDDYYSIEGNGNFNKSDNIIKIKTNDSEYVIHAYKGIKVSKIDYNEPIKEMSNTKKEIVKLIIITISCVFIFLFYYLLFIYHI